MSNDIDCADLMKDVIKLARLLKECDLERIKQMRAEDKEFDDAFNEMVRLINEFRRSNGII